jgi:HEAT repeat protein
MKMSRVRAGISVILLLFAAGVAGLELKDGLGGDESSEAQIRKLESYWPSRRRAAATELAHFTGEAEKLVPKLVKALGDSDTDVRLNAMESLKSFGEQAGASVSVVMEMLKNDPDARIRRRAAGLLGAMKDQAAAPVLVNALDDRDPAVRVEATQALARFGHGFASEERLVDRLISALGLENPADLREASVEALDSVARDQVRAARAIADVAAKDPSPDVRYTALGIMKTPIFPFQVPALIAALDDPVPRIRLLAGGNLAWIGMTDDRTVPAVCRAALKADATTREGIGMYIDVLALDRPTDKAPDERLAQRFQTAVNEFRTVVETPKAAARLQVINVLGRLIGHYQQTGRPILLEPARSAVHALLARVADENEEVSLRLHALNQWSLIELGQAALSRTGAPGSADSPPKEVLHARALWIAALCRALKSSAPEVRSRAGEVLMDGLRDPGTDPSLQEAWRQAVLPLAEATKSEDIKVRNGALAILTRLGPEAAEALPALRSLAAHTEEASLKSAAAEAIKSVACVEDLKARDPAVRIAASDVIGRLGRRASPAVPILLANLRDPEADVRAAAANALKALGSVSDSAVPTLAIALAGEADAGVRVAILEAIEGLASGAILVVDAHLKALRDPDPAVRKAAASFKIVPANDSIVTALGTALGDSDDEVRLTAARSLSEIIFANAAVVPALFKAMAESKQRTAVLKGLSYHLAHTTDAGDFRRMRGDLPGLTATLHLVIPSLIEALNEKDDEIRRVTFGLLGRIVSFSDLSNNEELRKAIEPAVPACLQGLDDRDPSVRAGILGRLDVIPIGRAEIKSALQKLLGKPDLAPNDRDVAQLALKSQATPDGPADASRRKQRFGSSMSR